MGYALKRGTKWTAEEYLAFDRAAPEGEKYEFIDGEVVPWSGDWKAMAGASTAHNRIMLAVSSLLFNQLRGKPCEPFNSEQRVQMMDGGYVYPDVFVACEPEFLDAEFDTVTNPVVIIEVLSPTTERKDRTSKFNRYRQIPSLRDYILVEQNFIGVTHHSRAEDGEHWWTRVLERLDEELVLSSIDCRLKVEEIYERVRFDEPSDSPENVMPPEESQEEPETDNSNGS